MSEQPNDQLADELEACRAELSALKELTTKVIHFDQGSDGWHIDATMQGDLVRIFAATAWELFDGAGAVNCCEFRVTHPDRGEMAILFQRGDGKTPMQLKAETEKERDERPLISTVAALLWAMLCDRGEITHCLEFAAQRTDLSPETRKLAATLLDTMGSS